MPCLNVVTSEMMIKTLTYSAFAFGIVALADFAYQRRSHTKSLMMSKDEIKREYKESEGDPHIKGKRKQIAQELASSDSGQRAQVRLGRGRQSDAFRRRAQLSSRGDAAADGHRQGPQSQCPFPQGGGREGRRAGLQACQARRAACSPAAEPGQPVPDELFDAVAEILAWVARHRETLYNGPSTRGVIDMEAGEHTKLGPARLRSSCPSRPARPLPWRRRGPSLGAFRDPGVSENERTCFAARAARHF